MLLIISFVFALMHWKDIFSPAKEEAKKEAVKQEELSPEECRKNAEYLADYKQRGEEVENEIRSWREDLKKENLKLKKIDEDRKILERAGVYIEEYDSAKKSFDSILPILNKHLERKREIKKAVSSFEKILEECEEKQKRLVKEIK